MNSKILIIEDESAIRGFIKINLKRNNYHILEAETGEDGITQARLEKPDIVVLDIMLPGMDGFEVCRLLRREFPEIGIIMLTARSQDMDKIMGLEYGADDYVVKPFNPFELLLRIEALLRRLHPKTQASAIQNKSDLNSGPFRLDTYAQKIYKENEELILTPREYLLLKCFLDNPGKAFSRDELLDLVWGDDFFGDTKIVDVNIRRLRKKIEINPAEPEYIETIWGTGYRWND